MKFNKRFSFSKVFWVVFGINLFMTLIGYLFMYLAPQEGVTLEKLLSWKYLAQQVLSLMSYVLFYYFTCNYYYHFFATRKGFLPFLKVSVIGALLLMIFQGLSAYLMPDFNSREKIQTTMIWLVFAMATVFAVIFGLFVAYLIFLRDEKKQQKILEEQKLQLEVEKSQANLNFLKAQINPHFLHNTLNFLYAKSLPYSPELSEGILTLSDIMRYALSEGNSKDGKAPLRDEIEHVRNVIKINQLRFSNNLNVDFEVHGVVNGATIIPFVLITLVENAFKHGDLKSCEHPIAIRIDVNEERLRFNCRNRKKSGPKELSTGIGLDNIRKRLDLAYGKDYSLQVKDETDFYSTELIISKL